MMNQHTIEKMVGLKLYGMARAFEEQQANPAALSLAFEERLGLMVDCETTFRKNKRLQRLLQNAKLKFPSACIEDIDYSADRELDRSKVASLSTCNWVRNGLNVLVTGATGTGKTWLACALANQACRYGLTAHFVRLSFVLEELALSHADGSFRRRLSLLGKFELLVIDDLGTQALDAQARADLLELIEIRSDGKSTIVTSQLPISIWHDFLSGGNKTVADATLDRLVSGSVKVILKGESIRRKKGAKLAENPQHADLFGHPENQ